MVGTVLRRCADCARGVAGALPTSYSLAACARGRPTKLGVRMYRRMPPTPPGHFDLDLKGFGRQLLRPESPLTRANAP